MDKNDEVEKQMLVYKLINGSANQEERDRALASVMLSLWGQEELKSLIRMIHNEECGKCPLKRKHECAPEESDTSTWKKIVLMLVQYGGWLILIIAQLLKVSVK